MMIKNPLYRLYLLACAGFVLALIKYVFVGTELSPNFLMVEILSFSFFLGIIYWADKVIRLSNSNKKEYNSELDRLNSKYQENIAQLNKKIKVLTQEQSYNLDEFDSIADKIVLDLKDYATISQFSEKLLSQLSNFYEVVLGICYFKSEHSEGYSVKATFGLGEDIIIPNIESNEGMNGQAILDKCPMVIDEIDETYFSVESCSGSAKPKCIYLLPIVKNKESIGLVEIATFRHINIEKHWDKINSRIVDTLFL